MRDDGAYLRELQQLLQDPTLPDQKALAAAVGVDQPFVSNAKNGRLRRVTKRVEKLRAYLDMRVRGVTPPHAVARSVRAYLRAGGDPDLLIQQVQLLSAAQARTRR